MVKSKVRKRRILVVEPDREFRDMIVNFLVAERFDAVKAETGDEALAKSLEIQPDIILLSRELPMNDGAIGPDGLRVLKVIKQDRKQSRLPIILTSATATESDFDRYRKLKFAADDYVKKPFEDTEILRRIENLVGFDLSDGQDLHSIKAKIEGVVKGPENGFFNAETDSIGPAMSAATRQEITKLLEQVGEELERQEQATPADDLEDQDEIVHPEAPSPTGAYSSEAVAAELRRARDHLQNDLEQVRKVLLSERKRSRDLKGQWKKKLGEILGKLRGSEEREAAMRDEFETMRKRFADMELDHTMELEREKEQRRRVEEELMILMAQEEKYSRYEMEQDIKKLAEVLDQVIQKVEDSKR